ncbi:urease accessory protein UreF [Trichophaea hybrida]|nr:urease accessory protein UreF [Trichophaea hybrida]
MISHTWLLISDSALPLGSFAFSSSLESYVAHASKPAPSARELVTTFLGLSLKSTTYTILPFIINAYTNPSDSAILDDELDASTSCNVARRASTSQGRALMTVWDKSLSASLSASDSEERQWVDEYKHSIRKGEASGHFGIAWGVICRASGLQLEDVCYVFMFNHCKAVLSSAVRLGLIGPYHAQAMLALERTRKQIQAALTEGKMISVDDMGQTVPVLDLYQGRHELLYSRVFNS